MLEIIILLLLSNIITGFLLYRAYKTRKPIAVANGIVELHRAFMRFELKRNYFANRYCKS